MGLEWHNRKRSTNGRFAVKQLEMAAAGAATEQLHIRVPAELAERIRSLAIEFEQEISEFCSIALMNQCEALEEDEDEE